VRSFESAYRIGGEEFLILLPDVEPERARFVAERIRGAVRSRPCHGLDVTVSIGVAGALSGEPFSYEDSFRRADAALYAAKRRGRDSVAVGPECD
jgi:diguanylate cyclase (GGDEF)-like protein